MSELSAVDLQAIEQLHTRWIDYERAGDNLSLLRLCTDDVMWLPPNSPALIGQQAIIQWLRSSEAKIVNLEITDLRIRGSGSLAYKTSNYSTAYVGTDSPETKSVKGSHVWILHKLTEGGWKVALVTWSTFEPK